MVLPRRLMTYTDRAGHVQFCEADDVRQEMNYRPKGFVVPDAEAERIGLKAYLDRTGWGDVAIDPDAPAVAPVMPDEKSVPAEETEDKAVDPDAVEDKGEPPPGLHLDPALRRGRRGG